MTEDGACCTDVLKQLSAVRGALLRASRLVLRQHLETCTAAAKREGPTRQIIDELLDALRFEPVSVAAAPTVQPANEKETKSR